MMFTAVGGMVTGLTIAFIATWQMALIGVGLTPLVIVTMIGHGKMLKGL